MLRTVRGYVCVCVVRGSSSGGGGSGSGTVVVSRPWKWGMKRRGCQGYVRECVCVWEWLCLGS